MATIVLKYDGRNSIAKSIVKMLETIGVFTVKTECGKNDFEINDIANSITEKYMSKRTKKGKLTETEMAVLNSKINMSKHLSKKL